MVPTEGGISGNISWVALCEMFGQMLLALHLPIRPHPGVFVTVLNLSSSQFFQKSFGETDNEIG
jgi:hypothetical protein